MPCGSPSQLRNLALNFKSSGWSPGLWCCLSGALPVSDTILRLLTFHAESCPAPTFLGPVEPSHPLTGPHVRAVPRPCGAWQPRGGQLAARFWDPAWCAASTLGCPSCSPSQSLRFAPVGASLCTPVHTGSEPREPMGLEQLKWAEGTC